MNDSFSTFRDTARAPGTLVALGAHELIISDHGELGPLDVQMTKKDEIWEMQSGLTVMDALRALKNNAFRAYHEFFEDLMDKGGGSISLKTASQIATDMTTGMFAPIYGQLNPLHIGEAGRAMDIAGHYGKRFAHEKREHRTRRTQPHHVRVPGSRLRH